ncbi:hypothetical protein JKF63_04166 [Porcisia hertigi]|uniref:Uncharacterized protein n=1 Tax=Porcisia hertigi TaxID=2761500 RepID=A0A836INJ6_9TRYP|nr:hypothetical protein JKF63_04166 [Porcisia hertigi]
MKRSAMPLHTNCHLRSCRCITAAGGGSDALRCHARSVVCGAFWAVDFGSSAKPPSRASIAMLDSVLSSSSIAQRLQRRHVHNSTPVDAMVANQQGDTILADPPGPSNVSSSTFSVAKSPDVTADTSEASLVAQLQILAKQYRRRPHSSSVEADAGSDPRGAGVPASADTVDALANPLRDTELCVGGTRDKDTVAVLHSGEPAWQRGVELVQNASHTTQAIMEWLLFVCLRSNQSATVAAGLSTGAPLEVLEGVYAAWRHLHRTQRPVHNTMDVAEATISGEPTSPSSHTPCSDRAHITRPRSPFTPKGIHHHYATYLLSELHRVQAAAVSCGTPSRCKSDVKGDLDDDITPKPTGDSDAVRVTRIHRAHYLLNRALEVLLVHLPQDVAAAAANLAGEATEKSHGLEGARSQKNGQHQTSLRPTTALLVLEAVRHAALLRWKSSMPLSVGLSDSCAFLSRLWGRAENNGPPHDAPAASPSLAHTALASVAREAFENVMRSSVGASMHMPAGASEQQKRKRLLDDAVVLYVAFLAIITIPPMSETRLEVQWRAIDSFVLAGSWTARQFNAASPHQEALSNWRARPLVGPARTPHDPSGSASSPSSLATATGMRLLLRMYLAPPSAAAAAAPAASGPETQNTRRQCDLTREAVIAALCNANSLLTLSNRDPLSPADSHEQDAHGVPLRPPALPLPWCAWILRVLVHDDALQTQEHGSEKAFLGSATDGNAHEVTTLALSIRLVMELQRHSHVTLARYKSPRLTENQLHRCATRLRRVQQLVWTTLLDAAVRGQFTSADLHRGAAGHNTATPHGALARSGPHHSTPAVLHKLCHPYYDKTQWHRGSVNLYMRLLDQWGESTQVRQVFAAVARRERKTQLEIHTYVLALHRRLASGHDTGDDNDERDSARLDDQRVEESGVTGSPAADPATRAELHTSLAKVSRRYRPALNLESCLITLRHCGCPRRVLAELLDEPAISEDESEGDYGALVTASQARLAGEVLQYMICSLHAVELRAGGATPSGDGADADQKQRESENATDTQGTLSADDTVMAEGLPVSRWVMWIRSCCVPAIAHLYQVAGLKDDWAQLGYDCE